VFTLTAAEAARINATNPAAPSPPPLESSDIAPMPDYQAKVPRPAKCYQTRPLSVLPNEPKNLFSLLFSTAAPAVASDYSGRTQQHPLNGTEAECKTNPNDITDEGRILQNEPNNTPADRRIARITKRIIYRAQAGARAPPRMNMSKLRFAKRTQEVIENKGVAFSREAHVRKNPTTNGAPSLCQTNPTQRKKSAATRRYYRTKPP